MAAGSKHGGTGVQWHDAVRNAALIAVLLVMLWLAFNVRLPSVAAVQAWVGGFGWAAPPVFVGLYAVVGMTPIPISIMSLSAGLLFGVAQGSALSIIGAVLGCWGAYWLARLLGQGVVLRLLGRHAPRVETHLRGAGFQAVVMLRLLPGFPYWPVNYGSGSFGVRQRDFMVATGIAIIPGQVALVAVGSFIAEPELAHAIVAGVAWLVTGALMIWAYRAWRAARRGSDPAVDAPGD